MNRYFLSALLFSLFFSGFSVRPVEGRQANWKKFTGHTALSEELGTELADGTGVDVCQVEAPDGSGRYSPIFSSTEYFNPDKVFVDLSQLNSGPTSHANSVGSTFYGRTISLAPGIINVFLYDANDWINNATGFSGAANPDPQPFGAQNHSWVADQGISDALAQSILMRVDYMAAENNLVVVAGLANSSAAPLPRLLVHGFNMLTVGKQSGNHSSGLTRFYFADRVKPEIVAPSNSNSNDSFTSFRVPMVAGTAAILRDAELGTNADNSEVVRALIMAGATKTEFANWQRTQDRPIDSTFGAGELNVYNSYRILEAGETNGQPMVPSTNTDHQGWDFGSIGNGQSLFYSIELTEPADHLSIALNWDIEIEDVNSNPDIFVPSFSLADLNLGLSGPAGTHLSVSTNHNLEHLYVRDLEPGVYTLVVSTEDNQTVDFGLAWRAALKNTAAAKQVAVVQGSNVGGSLSALAASDDSYYELQPDGNSIVVEIESTSPENWANSIALEIESNANSPNIEQRIEVFNFMTEAYETFDTSSLEFSDSESTGYVFGELYEFVDEATGVMKARLTWEPTGPVLQYPWKVRIDKAGWTVSK